MQIGATGATVYTFLYFYGAKLVKILHIEFCEYVSLLYLDLHFDDNISGSYVEGIQRF